MGGSMSSSSLYRTVATVEIIASLVIGIFGVNTFLLFQQQNDKFQTDKEMILYSSIVAVVQSILTVLSSILLVGCLPPPPPPPPPRHHESQWVGEENGDEPPLPPPPPLPSSTQIGRYYSLRRKALAPTWISWTLISIACLLFVFIAPIHYCIQGDADLEKLKQFTKHDGYYETIDNKMVGLCFSEAEDVQPIRTSLKDLYSFSLIGAMFKALFMLMVHRNWKRAQARAKKVIIYVEQCGGGGGVGGDAEDPDPTPEPKISGSGSSAVAGNIGSGDAGGEKVGKKKKKDGAEVDERQEKIKK